MSTIDSHEIRLGGRANIEHSEGNKLELGHDYTLGLTVNCHEISNKDNQNGTDQRIYKFALNGGIVISKDWGKTIMKAKGKGSPSQKMRNALRFIHDDKKIEVDFDDWYKQKISYIISKLEEII